MTSERFKSVLFAGAAALAVAGVMAAASSAPAEAHVRVGLGFGFFGPVYAPPPVYYYPPPPVYYAPPPVYYAPPPAPVAAPLPIQPQAQTGECREYNTTNIIGGVPQQTYGTACRQPDGTWRIIN